jgi:hypothetical protein
MSYLKKPNIVFACIGIVAALGVWTSARMKMTQAIAGSLQVKLLNKTNALKIVDGREKGEGLGTTFEITLLNQSDKTVVAYTLSSGTGGLTSFGFLLAPGQYKTERFPVTNLERSATDGSMAYLELSAAYLQDGTTEGENISVVRLKNRVLGVQEQAAISLNVLRHASASRESDPERIAKLIEDEISMRGPQNEDTTKIASERLAGRQYVKEKISRELKEIRSGRQDAKVHENLQRLITGFEELAGGRKDGKQ